MNKKMILASACILIAVAFLFVLSSRPDENTSNRSVNEVTSLQTISYDASKEYEEALNKYNSECSPAGVIRDDNKAGDKEIAIVFEGLSETVTVEKILSMLDEYGIKATFAISAVSAAEDSDTVQLIDQKGHDIADKGLRGETGMESLSDEELIYNFTYSKKVFSTLLNKDTQLMMLDRTLYTNSLCLAAAASGYDKLISPSSGHFLNKTSFADYDRTAEYVSRLDNGTILVIKLDGYIDALEMEPKVEERDPAKDKKASLNVERDKDDLKEDDILQTVEWILKALDENDCKTVMASSLRTMTNEEYVKSLFDEGSGIKASVYSNVNTIENTSGLVFKGMTHDNKILDGILNVLEEKGARATFFVSAKDVEEYAEQIEKIADAGFAFGTLGTDGRDLAGEDRYTVYEDITLGERAIKKAVSLKCNYYMPAGEVDDEMLYAAGVAGMTIIIPKPSLGTIRGDINLGNPGNVFDAKAVENFINRASSSDTVVTDITGLLKNAEMIPAIDQEVLDELRQENEGKLARENPFIYTTEKAMVITFYGVDNMPVVKDVLKILDERGYKGTFFVTADNLKNCEEQIKAIIDDGHEIGIAYVENSRYPAEFDVVASYILGSQQFLEWKYGVKTSLVKQPYGEVAKETQEAVSATGCTLVGHEYTLVQSEYLECKDVNEFYGKYSGKINAHRGSIAYFSMNNFVVDKELDPDYGGDTLLGNLLKAFINRNIDTLVYRDYQGIYQYSTRYTVRNYSSVAHTGSVYSPGRAGANRTVTMNNNVLGSMADTEDQNAYILSRYIGNPAVTEIPGLSSQESVGMDTKGFITNDRTIFLTFDDWGNDVDVNQLLYVMNKYGVKGTFFIRTNYVSSNPNLLRAIAAEGHAVASHTNSHMQLSTLDPNKPNEYSYISLTEEQGQTLRRDLVTSYDVLNRYTGDVVVGGKRSLTTLFRSPTLAVSRIGMYQVFDTGFSYMVSGSLSTQDYKAGSVDELVDLLRNGRKESGGYNTVGNGTCLVMHMSPDAKYTAEALDIMIPEWQAQGYTFNRLDDYLR